MSMKRWCNLCYCSYTKRYTHVNGKRHKKRLRLFTHKAIHLSDEIKYQIISFLYPKIFNIKSLYRELHYMNMRSCCNELSNKTQHFSRCAVCFFPKVIMSFEEFEYSLNYGICINCAIQYTTSTYFNHLPLYIYQNKVKICSWNEYAQLNDYYKFDRILQMIRNLILIQNRNSINFNIFDLSMLPMFWNLDDFLVFLYNQSYTISHVIELYRTTQT